MRDVLAGALDLVCGGDELLDADEAVDHAAALDLLVDGCRSLECDRGDAAALPLADCSRSLERDLEQVASVDILLVRERDLWRPSRGLCSIEQPVNYKSTKSWCDGTEYE